MSSNQTGTGVSIARDLMATIHQLRAGGLTTSRFGQLGTCSNCCVAGRSSFIHRRAWVLSSMSGVVLPIGEGEDSAHRLSNGSLAIP